VRQSKFVADVFTKDLKSGKLPYKAGEHDRIANYGKGFSNLLQMTDPKRITERLKSHYTSVGEDYVRHRSNDSKSIQENSLFESVDSKAAYALYRPDVSHLPDPLTFREAAQKYRNFGDPSIENHEARKVKIQIKSKPSISVKPGVALSIGNSRRTRHRDQFVKSVANDAPLEMSSFLGTQTLPIDDFNRRSSNALPSAGEIGGLLGLPKIKTLRKRANREATSISIVRNARTAKQDQ